MERVKQLKYLSDFLRNEIVEFGRFVKANTLLFVLVITAIIVIYGIKFFNLSYSIDTELMMTGYGHFLSSWLGLERYALVLMKRVLFPDMFNLQLASVLTYVALSFFCILTCYFVARARKKQAATNKSLFLVVAFLLVSPNLAEQLNFVLQSFEVVVGMIAGIVALFFSLYYLETGKKIFLVISAPFLIFSIMSYQSLVLFYAAGAIMLLITFATWRKNDMKNSHLRAFAAIVITGLAALIGYYLISKGYLSYKHIEASSYLTGQVPWGHKPFGEVAYTTYISIKMVVLGESNFYNKSFLFAFIGIAIYLLYRWIIQKKNSSKEAMYFMMLFTIPFLLTILLGGIEVARARMPALQLVVGFSVYFLYQHVKNKVLAFGVLFIALALCVSQGVVTSNLLYSEQIKYQNDVSTAGRIVSQLDGELSRPFSDYTFTLAGNNYHPTLPNFDPAGEMLGRSFFEFDQQSPAMWATSYRAANFMQTQGYDFKAPDVKQMGAVKSLSQERGMTVWPQKGSIYIDEQDNLIIVKMSEYKSN